MQIIPLRSAWVMSVAFSKSGNFVGKWCFFILGDILLFLYSDPVLKEVKLFWILLFICVSVYYVQLQRYLKPKNI